MAGPRGQSADTSLDDILSSIRKIVSEDLNGADALRDKLEAVQASRPEYPDVEVGVSSSAQVAQQNPALAPDVATSVAGTPVSDVPESDGAAPTVATGNTADLIAAARIAAGTPAREFVAAEPHVSQADVARPRESLAPFDRGVVSGDSAGQPISEHAIPTRNTQQYETSRDLGAPIVLPTEVESVVPVNGQETQPCVRNGHDHHAQVSQDGHVQPTEPFAPNGQPTAAVAPVSEHQPDAAVTAPTSPDAEEDPAPLELTEVSDTAPVEDEQPLDLGTPTMADGSAAAAPASAAALNGQASAHAEPAVAPAAAAQSGLSASVIEQTVTRMLRPMLKDWLDENMPRLIEQALREDVSQNSNTNT